MLVRGRAMEPPLEVRREEGVHGGVVAAVERLVEAEHEEPVALLLGLVPARGGEPALQLIQVSQLLPRFPAAPPVGDEEEGGDGDGGSTSTTTWCSRSSRREAARYDRLREIGVFGRRGARFIAGARDDGAMGPCVRARVDGN